MKRTLQAALLALLALEAFATDTQTWRVAGIMQGARGDVAIMESSSGEQALFREGDGIADARVAAIEPDKVTLELDGKEVVLALRGAAHALVSASGAGQQAPAGEPSTKTVAGGFAAQKLQQLLRDASDDAALQAGARQLFKLPDNATITGMNHEPPQPVRAVLGRMVEYLQLGRTVSLEFDGANGKAFVYIYPES